MEWIDATFLLEWWAWFYVLGFFVAMSVFILPAFGLGVWIYSLLRRGRPMPWRRIRWILVGVLLASFIIATARFAWCLSNIEHCVDG